MGLGTWRAAAFSRAAVLGPGRELSGAPGGWKAAIGDSVSLPLRLAGCVGGLGGGRGGWRAT